MSGPHRLILSIAGAVVLAGCGNLTSVYHRPDFDAKGVVMDAKQRAIVVKQWRGGAIRKSFACAEPSPDAMASFAASLGAEVKDPKAIEAAVRAAFGDSAASLGGRTATIQLFRDALYRACEALMNDAIEEAEYLLLSQKYQDAMVTLLAIEQLTNMNRSVTGATVTTTAAVPPSILHTSPGGGAGASEEANATNPSPGKSPPQDANPASKSGEISGAASAHSSNAATLSDQAAVHIANVAGAMVQHYFTRSPIELVCVQVIVRSTGEREKFRTDALSPEGQRLANTLQETCLEYLVRQVRALAEKPP